VKIDDTVLDPHETYQGFGPALDQLGPWSAKLPFSVVVIGSVRSVWCPIPVGASAALHPTRCCARRAPWLQRVAEKFGCWPGCDFLSPRRRGFRESTAGADRHRRAGADSLHVALSAGVFRRSDCGHGRVIQDLQTRTLPFAVSVGHGVGAHETGLQLWPVPRPGTRLAHAALPDVAITTDLLVGSAARARKSFADILRALPELRFDNAFTFAYSERLIPSPRAPCPTNVPAEVKQRRLAQVIDLQRQIKARFTRPRWGAASGFYWRCPRAVPRMSCWAAPTASVR